MNDRHGLFGIFCEVTSLTAKVIPIPALCRLTVSVDSTEQAEGGRRLSSDGPLLVGKSGTGPFLVGKVGTADEITSFEGFRSAGASICCQYMAKERRG